MPLRELKNEDLVSLAEESLTEVFGEDVRIDNVEMLSDEERRNLILRCKAKRASGPSQSIIIKATRSIGYDPASVNAFMESGLVREWAATSFLSTRTSARRHGAKFLTGDATQGMLIFEDLGAELGSLVKPLLKGSQEEAIRALLAYATALGRIHSDTVDCANAYDEALHENFPTIRRSQPDYQTRLSEVALQVREHFGETFPDDELAQIAHRLKVPGAWLCLLHGDPCPDNALISDKGVHLIDFEFGMPGHAILDAVYWRMGFPSCWCAGRIPASTAAQAETVYRTELGLTIGAALNDTEFREEIAYMAAAWLLRSFSRLLINSLKEDSTWGIASTRSRLFWHLEAAILMTEEADVLSGFRSVARTLLLNLRDRWPSTERLRLYPAFEEQRD